MSVDKLNGIIRTERDVFKTPNLYQYLGDMKVAVNLENFRDNKQDTELILFEEFEGKLYFPIWFEFRSINNNLLYLLEEFQVPDFKVLRRILESSLQKEEQYMATFQALVFKVKNRPKFSHLLAHFMIASEDRIDVYEP